MMTTLKKAVVGWGRGLPVCKRVSGRRTRGCAHNLQTVRYPITTTPCALPHLRQHSLPPAPPTRPSHPPFPPAPPTRPSHPLLPPAPPTRPSPSVGALKAPMWNSMYVSRTSMRPRQSRVMREEQKPPAMAVAICVRVLPCVIVWGRLQMECECWRWKWRLDRNASASVIAIARAIGC